MKEHKFIKIGNKFIDLKRIISTDIDDYRIYLLLIGCIPFDFFNAKHADDAAGIKLDNITFQALKDYLLQYLDAEDILTPVDKAFMPTFREEAIFEKVMEENRRKTEAEKCIENLERSNETDKRE